MLTRPNKAETAVHGCHYLGDMAVRMRKVLARPWVVVRVCHLLLLFFLKEKELDLTWEGECFFCFWGGRKKFCSFVYLCVINRSNLLLKTSQFIL